MNFTELNDKLKLKQPLSEEDLDFYTQELFIYYRETGYPNYSLEGVNCAEKFNSIKQINEEKYYDSNTKVYKKYQSLNGFLFAFFPHWISVVCGTSSQSLEETWKDDDKLKTTIRKALIWLPKHNEVWTTNRLRQLAKIYCSAQTVSNFNPVTAKLLYNEFGNSGTVLDMCSGWGGRLMGFIGSDCHKYIGCEVSTDTYNGLLKLKDYYFKYNQPSLFEINDKEIDIRFQGCETLELEEGSIDFAFTSPPYFDCEKYSNDAGQSYLKYNNKSVWETEFLLETFKRVFKALKNNSYMVINIANTPGNDWIENSCITQAQNAGFEYIETRKYELSSIAGKGSKYEPVFIFKKTLDKSLM